MDGTDKPTKGIPDTYYFHEDSNQYILVMFGTRKDSIAKLETDIREAIEKSHIEQKDIKEIICCHTSSNIPTYKDSELRKLAKPIKLSLIGIDTLSQDLLQFKYQNITKEFLGIDNTTEQVWKLDQFISIHDKSKTNASLDTTYYDNEGMVDKLFDDLNSNQVLVLTGNPGGGKTRLAVELCRKVPIDANVICVKSNNIPVYQDIKDALNENQLNYLLLDDANTVTNFNAVVSLLHLEEYEKELKIIITVRGYAYDYIANQLSSFKYKTHEVTEMGEEKLESLVKSIHPEILTQEVKRIIGLSHNNPRIAVLATKLIKEGNHEIIVKGKEILETYYSNIIKDNELSEEEQKVLFIISFLQKFKLERNDYLLNILSYFEIKYNDFIKVVKILHDKELCDIFNDKAAKISDQSLADFIIIEFIENGRRIKLRELFSELYPTYQETLVNMINLITNFNSSKEWTNYLTAEMKFIYKEILSKVDREQFLTQFAVIVPLESLTYVYKKINEAEHVSYIANQKEFEKKKKSQGISDPLIQILASLSNSAKFKEAGDLLIGYLEKRNDKVFEVFSSIDSHFDIEPRWADYLAKRFSILKSLKNIDKNNELLSLLVINIAKEFLMYSREKLIGDHQKVSIQRYQLLDGEYLMELHEEIWSILRALYTAGNNTIKFLIEQVIFKYPIHEINNGYKQTVIADLKYMEKWFFTDLDNLSIRQENIIYKLKEKSQKLEIDYIPFSDYNLSPKQELYLVFSSTEMDYEMVGYDYNYLEKLKLEDLTRIYRKHSSQLTKMFDLIAEYQLEEWTKNYQIESSLLLLYSNVDIENKIKILDALLSSKFTISYHPKVYMDQISYFAGKTLLAKVSVSDEILKTWSLSNDLKNEYINQERIEGIKSFVSKLDNNQVILKFSLLDFKSVIDYDNTLFDLLWHNFNNSKIPHKFFILPYMNDEKVNATIDIVGIEKLKKIYLASLEKELDQSGDLFCKLVQDQDEQFVHEYLLKLNSITSIIYRSNFEKQLKCIWTLPCVEDVIRNYLITLINEGSLFFVGLNSLLKDIMQANTEGAKLFILKEIDATDDENYMIKLINLSINIFDKEDILEVFTLLKGKQISEESFKQMHFTPSSRSWTGSMVPLLDKDINLFDSLLSIFDDVAHIPHASIISERKDVSKKNKEDELLADYLTE